MTRQKRSLLIVNDIPMSARGVREELKLGKDWDVIICLAPYQVVEVIENRKVDIALVDVQLGGEVDGFIVAEGLIARGVPVGMYSAEVEHKERSRAQQLGVPIYKFLADFVERDGKILDEVTSRWQERK